MTALKHYKVRKDSAINLASTKGGFTLFANVFQLFNLATQQDSAASAEIAREARADGTSMKIIAALTMVFLPGTFLSPVFGMASLRKARWWLYIALVLPLTAAVLVVWWLWLKCARTGAVGFDSRKKLKARNDSP
jgi:hypothetical protein